MEIKQNSRVTLYKTTIRIKAKIDGDEVNISATDNNNANAPSFYKEYLTFIMLALANITRKTFAYVHNIEEKYFEKGYDCTLAVKFKESKPDLLSVEINSNHPVGHFLSMLLHKYLDQDPEIVEFLKN